MWKITIFIQYKPLFFHFIVFQSSSNLGRSLSLSLFFCCVYFNLSWKYIAMFRHASCCMCAVTSAKSYCEVSFGGMTTCCLVWRWIYQRQTGLLRILQGLSTIWRYSFLGSYLALYFCSAMFGNYHGSAKGLVYAPFLSLLLAVYSPGLFWRC